MLRRLSGVFGFGGNDRSVLTDVTNVNSETPSVNKLVPEKLESIQEAEETFDDLSNFQPNFDLPDDDEENEPSIQLAEPQASFLSANKAADEPKSATGTTKKLFALPDDLLSLPLQSESFSVPIESEVSVLPTSQNSQPQASSTTHRQLFNLESDVSKQDPLEQLKTENAMLEAALREATEKAKLIDLQHKETVATYEKQIEDLKASTTAQIAMLTEKLTSMEAINKNLVKENEELKNNIGRLLSQVEQLKTVAETSTKNEGVMKAALAKAQKDLANAETYYHRLKTHAQDQLNKANAEIERILHEKARDSAALTAKICKLETRLAVVEGELALHVRELQVYEQVIQQILTPQVEKAIASVPSL